MKNIILVVAILLVQNTFSQIKKYGRVSKDEFGAIKNTRKNKNYKQRSYVYATKKIALYKGKGNDSESIRVKASTYNLVDDKIIKTKLKKANVFTTQKNKIWHEKSFTMPNLKEGVL